ncbi:enoyl-CoA delta isomerase 1, peroxisomal-like [Tripterygium wilfordii]|uniref:enoyl-CoA delta isomerase 1, peroxisomal-like n=1 Tax=Tripterygium wilfordii TaxID=458696 RepID=UPI0018F859B7|nr:enoyl-CoA delta isomerase 1, peroxisomal-like [Tripterygium wilfordii]
MCSLEKQGNIYILTLTGPDEHRLNPTLIDSIQSALRHIRAGPASPSSVLITTAHGKFFSNGFDLSWADSSKPRLKLMSSKVRSLVADLLSLPMPTVAAITGHSSAAGFLLALSHDYRLMRKDRGFLYMSELDINMVIPAYFMALIKCKVGDKAARREMIMKATKMTADMAVKSGIVDSVHDNAEETVKAVIWLGEELVGRKWDGHVYAQNRLAEVGEVLDKIGYYETVEGQNGKDTKSRL